VVSEDRTSPLKVFHICPVGGMQVEAYEGPRCHEMDHTGFCYIKHVQQLLDLVTGSLWKLRFLLILCL
jgi:hypothetical protein